MIVVEWKLTTFLRQAPWLDAPPRTSGVARRSARSDGWRETSLVRGSASNHGSWRKTWTIPTLITPVSSNTFKLNYLEIIVLIGYSLTKNVELCTIPQTSFRLPFLFLYDYIYIYIYIETLKWNEYKSLHKYTNPYMCSICVNYTQPFLPVFTDTTKSINQPEDK